MEVQNVRDSPCLNRCLLDWTTAMDKKKGEPSQKTFEDHSFIKRSAKFVRKCKTCEFLEISREIHHE